MFEEERKSLDALDLKKLLTINKGYTYNELVSLLKIPNKSGNSKPAQLKFLYDNYFQYVKEGTRYVVTFIFDKHGQAEIFRFRSDAIYTSKIAKLLIEDLYKENNDYYTFSLMMKEFWMVNPNYSRFHWSSFQESLREYTGCSDSEELQYYWELINHKLYTIIYNSIQNIKKRGLITDQKMFLLSLQEDFGEHETYEELATEKQSQLINEVIYYTGYV